MAKEAETIPVQGTNWFTISSRLQGCSGCAHPRIYEKMARIDTLILFVRLVAVPYPLLCTFILREQELKLAGLALANLDKRIPSEKVVAHAVPK